MCSESKLAENSSWCGERKHRTRGSTRHMFSMKIMYRSKTLKVVNDAIIYVVLDRDSLSRWPCFVTEFLKRIFIHVRKVHDLKCIHNKVALLSLLISLAFRSSQDTFVNGVVFDFQHR